VILSRLATLPQLRVDIILPKSWVSKELSQWARKRVCMAIPIVKFIGSVNWQCNRLNLMNSKNDIISAQNQWKWSAIFLGHGICMNPIHSIVSGLWKLFLKSGKLHYFSFPSQQSISISFCFNLQPSVRLVFRYISHQFEISRINCRYLELFDISLNTDYLVKRLAIVPGIVTICSKCYCKCTIVPFQLRDKSLNTEIYQSVCLHYIVHCLRYVTVVGCRSGIPVIDSLAFDLMALLNDVCAYQKS